jgi:hypothetical protein
MHRGSREVTIAGGVPSARVPWLLSRRADFWWACGGGSAGLLAAMLLIVLHGDRELDAVDFVLSELHLGATYEAIVRRRLWRHCRIDVLLVPLVIVVLTYALSLSGHSVALTSIAMYAAVWHRGRQSLGVARFYQRAVGGPVSRTHDVLFRGAIYLPILAAALAYTHLAPAEYEGEPYLALGVGAPVTALAGSVAAIWVIAYVLWVRGREPGNRTAIHPGEGWVVLSHAVALACGYVLGASNASYLLVLVVHHEVQYLYFAYAVTPRPGRGLPRVARFLTWPALGFGGALLGGWASLPWLAPLGMAGLFCHYWLDGRIWRRRAHHA